MDSKTSAAGTADRPPRVLDDPLFRAIRREAFDALGRVHVMRAELVRLGCANPAIIGDPIIEWGPMPDPAPCPPPPAG
jgi:hypothetical protein